MLINTKTGPNKTGMDLAPVEGPRMMENAELGLPSAEGICEAAKERMIYIREAEPPGSIPLPGTLKGVAKTALKKLAGKNPELLLDKIGERLAFERTGVRFYELFLNKIGAHRGELPEAFFAMMTRIHDDELRHFGILAELMRKVGGDPTALTPCANTMAVATSGVFQILSDPRTSVVDGLQCLLLLELTDNDQWEILLRIMDRMGVDEKREELEQAIRDEDRHLSEVREWINKFVVGEAAPRGLKGAA